MNKKVKPADFHVSALKTINKFSLEVKKEIGEFIMTLEMGLDISDFDTKPMKSISAGSFEFRTYDNDLNYRVFYYAKLKDTILIFHAFTKKTKTTTELDKKTGKARLTQMLSEYNSKY